MRRHAHSDIQVTLLSVCGSSVSEVASCLYTQVEVTYGSSGNGVSEGSVLVRIPEVTALPPSVLFPVSVWTRIASERRKKLLQVSTHASNIAFKSSGACQHPHHALFGTLVPNLARAHVDQGG